MRKIIVAGFPGVGKSEARKRNPEMFYDLESSNFHWIYGADGEKHLHPEWPVNYIDAIKAIQELGVEDEKDQVKFLCISTHKEVLNALFDLNLPVITVVPKTKEIYLQRYKDRGSSNEFIEKLNYNFYQYISDIKEFGYIVIETDSYLMDILDEESYFSFIDNTDLIP